MSGHPSVLRETYAHDYPEFRLNESLTLESRSERKQPENTQPLIDHLERPPRATPSSPLRGIYAGLIRDGLTAGTGASSSAAADTADRSPRTQTGKSKRKAEQRRGGTGVASARTHTHRSAIINSAPINLFFPPNTMNEHCMHARRMTPAKRTALSKHSRCVALVIGDVRKNDL